MNKRRVRITNRHGNELQYEFQVADGVNHFKTEYYMDSDGPAIHHVLIEQWMSGQEIEHESLRINEEV